MGRADTPTLCAVRHGAVVGVAAYLPHASTARGDRPRTDRPRPTVTLHQLHVDPAHWGTGVGHALHIACLRAWRTAGFARAVLDVRWHNHRARTFYGRLGWRPDPDRRPAPDATHLTLALELRPAGRSAPAGR
ncbi:GNAT family N-acetyltransferase [Streptomyces sp. NPDC048506]|uniref:GNAT family N-acetyltransferase n=1 Tax=Streptomyces sp. NPDC048506 TaxID=3155028 RepID=UPI00342716ED